MPLYKVVCKRIGPRGEPEVNPFQLSPDRAPYAPLNKVWQFRCESEARVRELFAKAIYNGFAECVGYEIEFIEEVKP